MRGWLLCVAAAAMFAGCGGSDSEDDGSRGVREPSADARRAGDRFVRRVDALCKESNPERVRIMAAITRTRDAGRAGRLSLPRTFDAFATLLRRATAVNERFGARLRAIAPPSGEREFHEALIRSVETGSANLRRQVSAAEAQDATRLRDLSVKGSLINERGKGLIAGHGSFRHCGGAGGGQ